jgi:type VI secretion system secreted protein Hcp
LIPGPTGGTALITDLFLSKYTEGSKAMASDGFVKIDGIEGESTDAKYQGWIEALYFESEINQKISSTASSAGGASAERADFGDFVFIKHLDKASPKLALACAAGTHIDEIEVKLCRAGSDKVNYMSYKLTNCIISKVKTSGGGNIPTELIKVNFGAIEWCYIQQKRQGGGPAGNIAAGWNLEKNCKR